MLALFKVHGMNVQVHCRREWGVDEDFFCSFSCSAPVFHASIFE